MATYVLIPGAGSDSWYWHRVVPMLRDRGHDVVAVDLPCDDDDAGLAEYTTTVVQAIGDRTGVILVAQSLGGMTAPLVCDHVPVDMIVLVAAMVPIPGESPGDWWEHTGQAGAQHDAALLGGYDEHDPAALFTHELGPELADETNEHVRQQSGTPFVLPWPRADWPDVPTRFLLCRDDRLFPAAFQRRVVQERLGIVPDEMSGGHLPALAHPDELVDWLERYRAELDTRLRT